MDSKNEIVIERKREKFKTFNETYRICSFALAIALIYPNSNNIRKKYIFVILIIAYCSIGLFWFTLYTWKTVMIMDTYNSARSVALGVIFFIFFFKTFYAIRQNDGFGKLLNKISEDLHKGNDLETDYQEIYEYYIKQAKTAQTCWIIIPILLSSQFALYAAACTMYESLKSDVGKKYMVHEMELKYLEHKKYESPLYEIMFAYQIGFCILISPNFAGFDGSFCIVTTHLRLKLKLFAHKVHRAFKDAKNNKELLEKIKETIKDHQDALEFYDTVQEVYGDWLFAVFLVTSLVIALNSYQMYLLQRIDPKCIIFAISGIVHMYTPCYYASNLQQLGERLSWSIYSAQWETWSDTVVTKMLIFMIAKTQQKFILNGKKIVEFNMALFLSIMQTSYSIFTLFTKSK